MRFPSHIFTARFVSNSQRIPALLFWYLPTYRTLRPPLGSYLHLHTYYLPLVKLPLSIAIHTWNKPEFWYLAGKRGVVKISCPPNIAEKKKGGGTDKLCRHSSLAAQLFCSGTTRVMSTSRALCAPDEYWLITPVISVTFHKNSR